MHESEVIARLRRLATVSEARGLIDDVAVLDGLVISHDSIAEGVHFLPFDPPASVGWKLAAVNLSDLAAKGARPAGALLSLSLNGDDAWEQEFLSGIGHACESYGLPIIGGDTITLPAGAPRVLGMTVIGRAAPKVPHRGGGRPGDRLCVIGTLGDSAAGLSELRRDRNAEGPLVDVYRRPVPQLRVGELLAPHVHAMMDVSDGLLLDALRMAEASGCGAQIELDAVPLSDAFAAIRGDGSAARLFAATAGDDYALLAAIPSTLDLSTLSLPDGSRISFVGAFVTGQPGIRLTSGGRPVELPETLGFEHSGDQHRPHRRPPMADRP